MNKTSEGTTQDSDPIIYWMNGENRIISIAGPWEDFSRENDAPELTRSAVIGTSLWPWISDPEAITLYAGLFALVREDGQTRTVDYRCDGPDCRRFMTLTVLSVDEEQLEVQSRLVRIEHREPISIFDRRHAADAAFIRMCSWCKKIWVGNEGWLEAETALQMLGFTDPNHQPLITHGSCQSCTDAVLKAYSVDAA